MAPTARADPATVRVAVSFDSEALPSDFEPEEKTTEPVGCAVPLAGRTVAVRFVEAFCARVVGFAVTCVEVLMLDTTEPVQLPKSWFMSAEPMPVTGS